MQHSDKILSPAQKRALIAGSVGNFIEWYEFAVYGFLATVMAQNFFRIGGGTALTGIILTYASFAIAFFFRPLGALIFGRMGDKLGRKPTLVFVLIMMTLTTTVMGLVPVYDSIGIAAPLIITGLRILQGLFAGGEYGGAVSLMTEFAPLGKRGQFGAWQSFTVALGLLAGVAIVALLSAALSPEALLNWGWRIPFFLAFPMGAFALWIRFSMEETPSFVRQQQERKHPSVRPVVRASGMETLKIILLGIGRVMLWSAAGYTYLVIMPTYLQSSLHTGFNTALLIAVISNLGFAMTIIPAGMLSDRIGRRKVMVAAALLLLILAMPLLKILQADTSLFVKSVVVFVAGGIVGLLAGPGPAMLAEMFPTRVRYTGLGMAYSLSNALFSGCAGLIITGLIRETGNIDIPAWYVIITALVSIPALMTLNKHDHLRSLDEYD